ncbi:DUF4199 domain-containing protein [Chitinophaga solisilvae]|uniref:DUF4199 domain-containing protein n=1 Tax=Chitinophaga solisilvae TaxID=1233460 RepID=A0A3S1DK20_9BACT|nr:DUF4199 domain-containing protein [Chitinophaga solisilvae]NSL86375.1 DUF4199 domain-containing protein [Chitinophaga solisilvae]
MKKNVIVFGLISGAIVTAMMLVSVILCYKDPDFRGSMVIGYTAMLLAFSFIFIGIKNYRDKYNGGVITFGKAFLTGLYIALIASTMYVVVWLISYYFFIPDFMERYSAHIMTQARKDGADAATLLRTQADMNRYSEMYRNPLFVVLLTYMEILPLGLLITLISALILKRRTPAGNAVVS